MIRRSPIFFAENDGGNGGAAGTLFAGAKDAPADATPQTAPGGSAPAWLKGDDGTFDPGWVDRLPESLRAEASLRIMPTISDLAKSYVETKKLVGTKLEMPNEKSTPEQLASWRKTVGAPDKPEGYLGDAKTLRPDTLPESAWSSESEKAFLDVAHKHSLPPAAVRDIIALHAADVGKHLQGVGEAQNAALAAEEVKLRTEWGAQFGDNLSAAKRMAQTIGLDPNTHPAFTDSTVVMAMSRMAKLLSEDKLVKGDAPSIGTTIEGRIKDIQDTKSDSMVSREYRGEFGAERQASAQHILHQLIGSRQSR